MLNHLTTSQKAYLAGFLDGDGSIYVRLKPNSDYRFGYQIAPFVVFFQAKKDQAKFKKLTSLIGSGVWRERKDGIIEYTINRQTEIKDFLNQIKKFLILKRNQADLMIRILDRKAEMKDRKDFIKLAGLIEKFRTLNYSKKRIKHNLTP